MTAKKNSRKKVKPSVKPTVGKLVRQPHGGALLPGAGGGPQPGSGRPPSAIREVARLAFSDRIPVLESIADNEEARDSGRISAIKALADAV